jgi:hypothetical protein
MPLVNELVIGLPDKDKFNMSEPKDDGQFDNHFPFLTTPFPGSPNGLNGIDPNGS